MYKIKDVSKKTGLSPHTLRYYDKEGLLPFVGRSDTGQRVFDESDLEWLDLISCLKSTGMPIRQIRHFIELSQQGNDTLPERLAMFVRHRDVVEKEIILLRGHLKNIECKIDYYGRAVTQGSEDNLDCHDSLLGMD